MHTSIMYMAEPPPGQIRHTVDAPNLHKELIAVGASTTIVAFVGVVLRVFTRWSVTKNGVHSDDYMVICAMVMSFALLACNFPHMSTGLGYHIWEVKAEGYMSPFQKWTLAGITLYATSLAFTKLSILLFYLRLSPHRWFRVLVWTLAVVVVVYVAVYNLISIFGCRPIAATWDLRLMESATCMDQLTEYMALSILNIIIDVLTLVLPIPIIARLQMPRMQKISVCAIFATGSFVCAVAIRRTTLLGPLMVSKDYTWDAVEQFQWCFAEVNAAILCACAPASKPFFVRYLPGLLSSRFRSHDYDEDTPKHTGFSVPKSPALQSYSPGQPTKDLYELQWRDDVYEEPPLIKRGANDDEARLWKGDANNTNGHVARKVSFQARASQRPYLDTRISSSTAPSTSSTGTADDALHSTSDRIHVTSETSISYGSPLKVYAIQYQQIGATDRTNIMAFPEYMADPPLGHTRHTTNAPNLHQGLKFVGTFTTLFAFISVALRLYTRLRITKNGIQLDDYMILGGLLCSVILLCLNFPRMSRQNSAWERSITKLLKDMSSGLGYHIWDVTADTFLSPFQKLTLAGTIFYAISLAFTKASILFFYLRLAPQKWFRLLVRILLIIVVAYATAYTTVSIFGCNPVAASWDLRLAPGARCFDRYTKYMTLSVLNIIIDLLVLLLPIPVVLPLQMPLRQKISVCLIFATGSFVCAIAIRRTMMLAPLMASSDYTWDAVEQFKWCFAEVNMAIACACAPALKPLFVRSFWPVDSYSRLQVPYHSSGYAASTNHRFVDSDDETTSSGDSSIYQDWYDDHLAEHPIDDETRLWRTVMGGKGASTTTITAGAESVSLANVPGRIKTFIDAKLRNQYSKHIHVQSETSVTYESL
ncbi:hypothetical protein OPT61_g6750 [Boeremia exigua]|uniref:Uncharacterized protein n=1 Tax=Boeremia exigua TaxID=749465 RepID=A0ACC2I523_9PLEO|nr:hypothetical protein OPT61_g6750 [Boeremia exigua]